jgi:hypothetical protein
MTKMNIVVIVLTLLSYGSIISIVKRKQTKKLSLVIGSQRDIHNMIKIFYARNKTEYKSSQMKKYEDSNKIDVLVIEDQAYWISNNVFYTGEIIDGQIDHDTTQPINTENMKKEEIDKMLFIVDNLKNGNKNDFGGTRN